MVSGSHDNNYKDECQLGCNNGKTDTSIMMFQRNLHLTIWCLITAGDILHGKDTQGL